MSDELPPCAYCGAAAQVRDGLLFSTRGKHQVRCGLRSSAHFCGMRTPWCDTEAEAAELWRRVNAPQAEIERLTLALERLRARFGVES